MVADVASTGAVRQWSVQRITGIENAAPAFDSLGCVRWSEGVAELGGRTKERGQSTMHASCCALHGGALIDWRNATRRRRRCKRRDVRTWTLADAGLAAIHVIRICIVTGAGSLRRWRGAIVTIVVDTIVIGARLP